MKEPNVWTYVKQIMQKTNHHEYDPKIAPAYVICLILSFDLKSLPIIQRINPLIFNLNDYYIYKYLYEKVPSGSRYINYIKSQAKNEKDENLQKHARMLNLSNDEIQKYRKLLKEMENES